MGVNAAERLIVALDLPHHDPDGMITVADARELVRLLGDTTTFLKIGWPLYMAGGHVLIKEFKDQGRRVFLDLKFGDIPETVRRLIQVAVRDGVDFLTLNTTFDAVRAAVEAAKGSPLNLLTVTVLTSADDRDLAELGARRSVADIALERARRAHEVGCQGIVSSGREARAIRDATGPDFLIVTPGIRPAGTSAEDHKRATTPGDAVRDGADYLVVGRPITRAPDPRAAALRLVEEMQRAFDARAR
ncbi:MAG: orotidine-5'-phosphate decarboxylase [Candidatus Rokuibacteriota bacterium]|nr:MAG: orotidine-5'-phosphate decarboxylase [Candidatus Rokubacteria bacterium]